LVLVPAVAATAQDAPVDDPPVGEGGDAPVEPPEEPDDDKIVKGVRVEIAYAGWGLGSGNDGDIEIPSTSRNPVDLFRVSAAPSTRWFLMPMEYATNRMGADDDHASDVISAGLEQIELASWLRLGMGVAYHDFRLGPIARAIPPAVPGEGDSRGEEIVPYRLTMLRAHVELVAADLFVPRATYLLTTRPETRYAVDTDSEAMQVSAEFRFGRDKRLGNYIQFGGLYQHLIAKSSRYTEREAALLEKVEEVKDLGGVAMETAFRFPVHDRLNVGGFSRTELTAPAAVSFYTLQARLAYDFGDVGETARPRVCGVVGALGRFALVSGVGMLGTWLTDESDEDIADPGTQTPANPSPQQ
jgi:hypothetical protein